MEGLALTIGIIIAFLAPIQLLKMYDEYNKDD